MARMIVMKGYKIGVSFTFFCNLVRSDDEIKNKTNDTAAAFYSQIEQSLFFFKFGWRRFGMIGQNIIRLRDFQIQNIEFEVFFKLKT